MTETVSSDASRTRVDPVTHAEFTTRFFRPMKTADVLKVESEVINRSRRVCVVETNFVNKQSRKLCAVVTGSWMLVNRDM